MELTKIALSEFDEIYADMKTQFPEKELKPTEYMKKILSGGGYSAQKAVCGNDAVGYIIVCECGKNLFAEYLAVFKKFHSHGFGSSIIKALKNAYPESSGCYFEVEHQSTEDPNTGRRIAFYERLGCRLLTKDYFLPYPGGDMPMNLYYLPYKERDSIPYDEVLSDLTAVFPIIYGGIPNSMACIEKFKNYNKITEFSL